MRERQRTTVRERVCVSDSKTTQHSEYFYRAFKYSMLEYKAISRPN